MLYVALLWLIYRLPNHPRWAGSRWSLADHWIWPSGWMSANKLNPTYAKLDVSHSAPLAWTSIRQLIQAIDVCAHQSVIFHPFSLDFASSSPYTITQHTYPRRNHSDHCDVAQSVCPVFRSLRCKGSKHSVVCKSSFNWRWVIKPIWGNVANQ